ncbi:glycosyltransferase [Acinetobacter modestus]|uniref:glycosyltransferase n=1 Tax=Acinetobacter modestus TaxID=1776740 RepID=UPI001F4B66F7|nr:glycosyltransferase [Acinetobacter modestus]MCH7332369.1 glycosyltransferase [Acinetobacter modestus]
MDILFIGKRFYTNRDAYYEKFGRIYQLPFHWAKAKPTELWLIDYHSKDKLKNTDEDLLIYSTPVFSFLFIFTFLKTIIKRPKIIIASGDCYIGLMSYILAKITFSKFIFDIYDKYDAFNGYRNLGFSNLLLFLIKKSDYNFFASRILAKEINQDKPYHILPNGVDYKRFKIINKSLARSFYNIGIKELIIGYIGSIERTRGIEDLIDAIVILRKQNININILIAGKNTDNLNLDYDFIHNLGNLEFAKIPDVISICDILAIPYRHSNQINYGTSCKIAEYIAMKKPIVATKSANLLEDFPNYIDVLPENYLAECHNSLDLSIIIKKQLDKPIILDTLEDLDWKIISKDAYFKIIHFLD